MDFGKENRVIPCYSTGMKSFWKIKSAASFPIFPAIAFLTYLALVPALLKRMIPCMNFRFGVSYAYNECNTAFILDRFLSLEFAGFAVAVLIMFFARKRKTLLPLAVSAVIGAAIVIGFYYLYIPQAEAAARNAPILLESLRDK